MKKSRFKKEIIKAWQQNQETYRNSSMEADYFPDEDDMQSAAQGIYLYTMSLIIDDMKKYIAHLINRHLESEGVAIDQVDVFSFLNESDIWSEDYSELSDKINNSFTEADYGQRFFYGDKETFKELEDKLYDLYSDFDGIEESIDEYFEELMDEDGEE